MATVMAGAVLLVVVVVGLDFAAAVLVGTGLGLDFGGIFVWFKAVEVVEGIILKCGGKSTGLIIIL